MAVDKILNGTTSRVKISGLLLVPCACEGRIKKIGLMNAWLRGWCVGEGGARIEIFGPLGSLLWQSCLVQEGQVAPDLDGHQYASRDVHP